MNYVYYVLVWVFFKVSCIDRYRASVLESVETVLLNFVVCGPPFFFRRCQSRGFAS